MKDSPLCDALTGWQALKMMGFGWLQVRSSPKWTAAESGPLTFSFGEAEGEPARLILTVAPLDASQPPPTPLDLWKQLGQVFEGLRAQVREDQPEPHGVATSKGQGCFFTVTDRALKPAPGEFLYQTSGAVPAGGVALYFTVLTNPEEPMVLARALETIRSAVHHPEGSAIGFSEPDAGTNEDWIHQFLDSDLNTEASLFVEKHRQMLDEHVTQYLDTLAKATPYGPQQNRIRGAVISLRQAGTFGICGVIAPLELSVPLHLVTLAADGLAGSPVVTSGMAALEAAVRQMGPEVAAAEQAMLHLMLATELMRSMTGFDGDPDDGPGDGSGDEETSERAIFHLEAARRGLTRETDAFLRAAIAIQLSVMYVYRLKDERAANIDNAIECAKSALRDLDGSGLVEDWIVAIKRLGLGYEKRIRGYKEDNLAAAIACFEGGLSYCAEGSSQIWGFHNNLGLTYLDPRVGDRRDSARKAIEHLETALKFAPDAMRVDIQANLGNAWRRLADADVEAMEKAIGYYTDAAKAYEARKDLENWAGVEHNLGIAYLERELGTAQENEAEALKCLTDALSVRTLKFPRNHRTTQIALGDLHLRNRRWTEAAAAYAGAIEADDMLMSMTDTMDASESEAEGMGSTYADAAYCLLRLERFEEAFLTLDKGNARTLGRGLEVVLTGSQDAAAAEGLTPAQLLEAQLDAVDYLATKEDDPAARALESKIRVELPGLFAQVREARVAAASITPAVRLKAYLDAIRAGGAIVAPIVTKVGSAVLVIPSGAKGVGAEEIVWVDEFAESNLARILNGDSGGLDSGGRWMGWLPAYVQNITAQRAWIQTIARAGSMLWDGLFAPVYARLQKLGLAPEAPVTLMLSSGLSVLPLHACWRKQDGAVRFLAEDFTLSYCPSALVMASTNQRWLNRQRMHEEDSRSLLVLANPTEDLIFAALEGRAIAALGDAAKTLLLEGKAASWSAAGDKNKGRDYVHFACHGRYSPLYPMRSYLRLAPPPERPDMSGDLRLRELMVTWDNKARLVTLSGCETGITDVRQAPAEFTGLSSGWLRTGAMCVVSSLWLVDDLSTMLLMERMYEELFGRTDASPGHGPLRPDAALRAAQIWLKDLSVGALRKKLTELGQRSGLDPGQQALIELRRQDLDGELDTCKPFREPYWWAGFLCSGA